MSGEQTRDVAEWIDDDSSVAITVVVPARNERSNLPGLIDVIESQTLRPREVVVVDGGSTDGTREWLEEAAASRPWLVVLSNPEHTTPRSLNLGIAEASSPIVARMDGHARYAPTYLARVAETFAEHPEVVGVGGSMESVGHGAWGEAIAAVLRRSIGLGGARHRVGGNGGPIDHVFSGAYRRDHLIEIGGYDPSFVVNQDFECDCRLRARGGVIWLEPSATCTWFVRDNVPALARQTFRYGFYRARTIMVHPDSVRARHLVPPLVILGPLALGLASARLGALAFGAYLVGALSAGAMAARADAASAWRGALVLPVVHLSWGAGLLGGLVAHRSARHHSFAGAGEFRKNRQSVGGG